MLFVSIYAYVTLRRDGLPGLQRQIAMGHDATMPAARTVAAARAVDDIGLHVGAMCSIARARCMAGGEFMRSGADVWLQCDEDVFASVAVVTALCERVRETHGYAVAAMPLRDRSGKLSVEHALGDVSDDYLASEGTWHPLKRGATGIAAMHRDTYLKVRDLVPWFRVAGKECALLFADLVTPDHEWQSEDITFCELARTISLPMEFLLSPDVQHDGLGLAVQETRR